MELFHIFCKQEKSSNNQKFRKHISKTKLRRLEIYNFKTKHFNFLQ